MDKPRLDETWDDEIIAKFFDDNLFLTPILLNDYGVYETQADKIKQKVIKFVSKTLKKDTHGKLRIVILGYLGFKRHKIGIKLLSACA